MSERVAVLLTGYGEVEDYDEFTEYNERSFRLLVSKSIKFPDFAIPFLSRRLERQQRRCRTSVMEGMAVFIAIRPHQAGQRDHQNRRRRRPFLVAGFQAFDHTLVFRCIILGRDDIAPRLHVVARCRPPRRFQDRDQIFSGDHTVRVGARAPAIADQLIKLDGRFGSFFWQHL